MRDEFGCHGVLAGCVEGAGCRVGCVDGMLLFAGCVEGLLAVFAVLLDWVVGALDEEDGAVGVAVGRFS